MEHRVKLKNVLSELTEIHHLKHQYCKPIYESCYINKRTTVLRELTKHHSYRDTCRGCGIGKIGTTALYSFAGYVFICNEACFQLHIDSIPYGIPG